MPTCKKCKTDKPDTEFYITNKSWCKECTKEAATASRLANIEKVRARDRARGLTRKKKKMVKAYAKTDRGKERRRAASAAWIQRNPEKRKAQVAVGNALRDGKLVRQPCEDCGKEKAQAHHEDYSKPLEVSWKCAKCHALHHRNERNHPEEAP